MQNSGKTNFLDALKFVLGATCNDLRVSRRIDLIHRNADPFETSVAVRFAGENFAREYQRSLDATGSETYRIDGEEVSHTDYLQELNQLNLTCKLPMHALSIGDFSNKSQLDRRDLIDHVSGSKALENDYKDRKLDLEAVETKLAQLRSESEEIGKARKEMDLLIKNRDGYNDLKRQYGEQLSIFYLFKLYHVEREITIIQAVLTNLEVPGDQVHPKFAELKQSQETLKAAQVEYRKSNEKLESSNLKVFRKESEIAMFGIKNLDVSDPLPTLEAQKKKLEEKIQNLKANLATLQRQLTEFNEFLAKDPDLEQIEANYQRLRGEFRTVNPFHFAVELLLSDTVKKREKMLEGEMRPGCRKIEDSLMEKYKKSHGLNEVISLASKIKKDLFN